MSSYSGKYEQEVYDSLNAAHPQGQRFKNDKRLSNGLHLESNYTVKDIARLCGQLLAEFGQDPAQFHVLLR